MLGICAIFNFIDTYEKRKTPNCLPKNNPNNIPRGTLSNSDFRGTKNYISYYIGVPNIDPTGNNSKTARIKVALAWNSKVVTSNGEPVSSTLELDQETYDMFPEDAKNLYRGYQISCAQLCGNSHYKMRGYMIVHENEDFNQWLIDNKPEEEEEEEW